MTKEIGSSVNFSDQQRILLEKFGAEDVISSLSNEKSLEVTEEPSKKNVEIKKPLIEDDLKRSMKFEEVTAMTDVQQKNSASNLLDPKIIEMKTDLNIAEIVAISKLLFLCNRYGVRGADDFVNKFMLLKVSRDRRGRGEFIQGLHAVERSAAGRDLSPLATFLNKFGL